MDRRERAGESLTAMLAMLQGWQSQLWTALPCVIQSFDPAKRTVVCASALNFSAQQPDGSFQTIDMPPLVDVPVFYPSGGGVTLTFPIKEGDECLVIFASRCIDAWWQNSAADGDGNLNTQAQVEQRMHTLSDGIAFVGISSVPKVIPNINATTAQFRNDPGDTYIELNPEDKTINIRTPADVTVVAGRDITAQAARNIEVTAGGDITVTADGDISVTASGNITAQASRIDWNP